MAVTSAAYLICSASILFFFIKWFVRIIDNIIERQQRILDEILALEREQTRMLEQIASPPTPPQKGKGEGYRVKGADVIASRQAKQSLIIIPDGMIRSVERKSIKIFN